MPQPHETTHRTPQLGVTASTSARQDTELANIESDEISLASEFSDIWPRKLASKTTPPRSPVVFSGLMTYY